MPRIRRLTAYAARIRFRGEVRHASHSRRSTRSILVACELDTGEVGWGEGLPRDYVTGETIDTAWQHLTETDFRGQVGEEFADLPDALAVTERLSFARPAGKRDCFGNSVRCAVELAMLDAAGKATGTSLRDLPTLKPEWSAIAERTDRVRYSAVVTCMKPRPEKLWSRAMWWWGFRDAKVKVGCKNQDEKQTLRNVRKAVGRKFDLRVDANESWNPAEFATHLEPCRTWGISSIEQPIPHAAADQLPTLQRQSDIPLMLDESLCSLDDAQWAIDGQAAKLFNIRLSKCGGIGPSLDIAAAADAAGLGYQLGCQVGETGILSAAGRHFATSVKNVRHREGSFGFWLVADRVTRPWVTFGHRGLARSLTGPGLGVTIDRGVVESVSERTHAIDFG